MPKPTETASRKASKPETSGAVTENMLTTVTERSKGPSEKYSKAPRAAAAEDMRCEGKTTTWPATNQQALKQTEDKDKAHPSNNSVNQTNNKISKPKQAEDRDEALPCNQVPTYQTTVKQARPKRQEPSFLQRITTTNPTKEA
ncbi:hypothetical protein CAEBREN_03586 [Caenorhabditis brenneri]|uniref:Uncharacterized protein n=1 Tax=Caenorhabditis brenneri TaxID=135651 RepID=G0N2A7_CAEBE|nr:hypothetical protein CAEBREN_03586 [Caenorhabditis brenneri]